MEQNLYTSARDAINGAIERLHAPWHVRMYHQLKGDKGWGPRAEGVIGLLFAVVVIGVLVFVGYLVRLIVIGQLSCIG